MSGASSRGPRSADELMGLGPVIPVIVIDRVADAAPLARALVAGGVRALEVTLRTPVAVEAIAAMCQVEGAVVGAGTLLNAHDVDRACEAGAQFLVSPGLTDSIARAAKASGLPFLPGVTTASEAMHGLDLGIDRFKFFPAETSGGADALKAFTGPFPRIRFCPTGGITYASAPRYLALANVGCIGGTWLTPKRAIEAGDWAEITNLAKQAAALAPT